MGRPIEQYAARLHKATSSRGTDGVPNVVAIAADSNGMEFPLCVKRRESEKNTKELFCKRLNLAPSCRTRRIQTRNQTRIVKSLQLTLCAGLHHAQNS